MIINLYNKIQLKKIIKILLNKMLNKKTRLRLQLKTNHNNNLTPLVKMLNKPLKIMVATE